MNDQKLLESLEYSLKHHNWFWRQQEDFRYWTEGKEHWERIQYQMRQLRNRGFEDEVEQLFDKYSPKSD